MADAHSGWTVLQFEDDESFPVQLSRHFARTLPDWEFKYTADVDQFKQLALGYLAEGRNVVYVLDNTNVKIVDGKKVEKQYLLQLIAFLAQYQVPLGRIIACTSEKELVATLDPAIHFLHKPAMLQESQNLILKAAGFN